jgi:RNA polymerase sigma-70 factor (ECF subfamily)
MTAQISDADDASRDPEQWVDLYGNSMYRYALARVSDPETAQDLVQEALVAAIQSYGRFQGRSSIKTWLIAILKRKIVDHYRRASNRQITDDIEAVANNVDKMFNDNGHWRVFPNEWTIKPDVAFEQQEFMDVLYTCISALPARLAEIFMLREFDEMSTKLICEKLEISESNSWVMLYRARMQLRQCLGTNWLDDAQ